VRGAVDLLQAEHVGVEVGHGGGDAFGVYLAVGEGSAVQEVEGGQTHGPTLANHGKVWMLVFIKALCCAAMVFVVLAWAGIWLQRRRGRR
jgi:hypothetical protein